MKRANACFLIWHNLNWWRWNQTRTNLCFNSKSCCLRRLVRLFGRTIWTCWPLLLMTTSFSCTASALRLKRSSSRNRPSLSKPWHSVPIVISKWFSPAPRLWTFRRRHQTCQNWKRRADPLSWERTFRWSIVLGQFRWSVWPFWSIAS